ncbi:MAG: TatD family hydrolase [Desulfobacterales bacterium]|nr:MAG: TatD family hydrolase [Desulfobacterales bacterium]
MLIDSHAHLDAPYFRNKLPDVLQRARQAGIQKVITIGVTPSSSRNSLQIAAQHASVYATVGYHPHWAAGATADRLDQAAQMARDPAAVALGEIGLDYYRLRSPKQDQIALFGSMLEIAVAVHLPVIIHDRQAHADVYETLRGFRAKLAGGIIHCFSGDWNLARKYLDWGFFLSIPGPVTYPRSRELREVAQKAPLNRLLVETDAPHLTPAQRKGRQNEPAFVRYTAQEVARLRNIALEEVARATTENVYQAFHFPAGEH